MVINMQPKRILHVIGSLNVGGSQNMVMNLYRRINKNEFQFDFIVFYKEQDYYLKEIEELGGKVYYLPNFSAQNVFKFVKSWIQFFESHSEHIIVHGHVRSTASIYLYIAKKFGKKTIAHSHSISNGTGTAAIVKDLLQIPIRFIADYFLAPSLESGIWLFGKKIVKSQYFSILKNSIDINKFKYKKSTDEIIRKKTNIENNFVIGHVGRFSDVKNHLFLIDIFKQIKALNHSAKLLLVGEGEGRTNIELKIKRENLEKDVIMLGNRDDVSDLMQAMDVFVFPSKFEGLGMVTIEAQTAGLYTFISDKVPEEVVISPIIEQIELTKSARDWAQSIIKRKSVIDRKELYKYAQQAGYDVNDVEKKLIIIYRNIQNN